MNSDQQFLVSNLQKMIKYIEQETHKKVELIKKEADKKAVLDKALLIDPKKQEICKKMEKDLEKYKTRLKIEQSRETNNLRLEKLKIKIEHVNSVFEETEKKLKQKIKDNPDLYKETLKKLIIQGLIKLLDNNVNIICKGEDYNMVCELVEPAKQEFLEKIKNEAKLSIKLNPTIVVDTKHYLPKEVIGGVFLTSMKNKIRVDNTFNKRLELVKQNATPEIRKLLFGEDKK